MPLQSSLFRNDTKLEACLIHDSAHVTQGAIGDHVSKIQRALATLDSHKIGAHELAAKTYGPSTAAAVLAFKQKRRIINRSYQTLADNIVGKMTIAALDQEMLVAEEIIAAVQPVIAQGRLLLRPPSPISPLKRSGLETRLRSLEKELADLQGQSTASPSRAHLTFAAAGAFPISQPAVDIDAVLGDLGLFGLVLLAILVLGNERHKTFQRLMQEDLAKMQADLTISSKEDARKARNQVKEVEANLEKCKEQQPAAKVANCVKLFEAAFTLAASTLKQRLFRVETNFPIRAIDVAGANRGIQAADAKFEEALKAFKDCLGCTNF